MKQMALFICVCFFLDYIGYIGYAVLKWKINETLFFTDKNQKLKFSKISYKNENGQRFVCRYIGGTIIQPCCVTFDFDKTKIEHKIKSKKF